MIIKDYFFIINTKLLSAVHFIYGSKFELHFTSLLKSCSEIILLLELAE